MLDRACDAYSKVCGPAFVIIALAILAIGTANRIKVELEKTKIAANVETPQQLR